MTTSRSVHESRTLATLRILGSGARRNLGVLATVLFTVAFVVVMGALGQFLLQHSN